MKGKDMKESFDIKVETFQDILLEHSRQQARIMVVPRLILSALLT